MPRNKAQAEQIRAESRKKILDTALHLFAERGYDGCNVSDIATQAGMSQGNVYWYFPSKREIYKTILVEGFAGLGSVMAEAAEQPGSAAQKLDGFLDRFIAMMKEPSGSDFVTLVVNLMSQSGVQHLEAYGLSTYEIGASYHQSLNAIFRQAKEEGLIAPQMDPNLLSTFCFSFLNGLMLMYPDVWKEIPESEIRKALLRLLGMPGSPGQG